MAPRRKVKPQLSGGATRPVPSNRSAQRKVSSDRIRPQTRSQTASPHPSSSDDPHYNKLRNRAHKHKVLEMKMKRQSETHRAKMVRFHKEASDYMFEKTNAGRPEGIINLHGQYLSEAIARTDKAIVQARSLGLTEISLIVGKGLHSPRSDPILKPAIKERLTRLELPVRLNPRNAGVLVVTLAKQGRQRTIGSASKKKKEKKKEKDVRKKPLKSSRK